MTTAPRLILASKSTSRRKILEHAGVPFAAEASSVDEAVIKTRCREKGRTIKYTARELALAKAAEVSTKHPAALVLGADQMLECKGQWFDKAATVDEARAQLRFLSNQTHRLITATVLLRAGKIVWENMTVPRLKMRRLSEEFIIDYCAKLGSAILNSVGCYQFEGLGAQLFSRVEGDAFSIQGLPLLPLLEALRREGVLRN